jgi:hypothetical protein
MSRNITDLEILQEYIQGVMDRAQHHANGVDEVCLALAGAIIWLKSGDIVVREQDGDMKNVLWVEINDNKYAFTYNHDEGAIDIKNRTTHGNVIARLTNENSISEVKEIFSNL